MKPNSLFLVDFNLRKDSFISVPKTYSYTTDKFNFQMHNAGIEPEKTGEPTPYYNPQPGNQNMPNASQPYPPPQPGPPGYPQQPMQPYPPAPMQQQPSSSMLNTTNTTVVIQQQPSAIVVQGPRDWSSGICACFDDCGVCKWGKGWTGWKSGDHPVSPTGQSAPADDFDDCTKLVMPTFEPEKLLSVYGRPEQTIYFLFQASSVCVHVCAVCQSLNAKSAALLGNVAVSESAVPLPCGRRYEQGTTFR